MIWAALALLLSVPASADVYYAPAAGAVTLSTLTVLSSATVPTVIPFDNSGNAASTSFVQSAIQLSHGTVPLAITGGTISFASTGTACILVYLASGGTITGVITFASAGSGYKVGDTLGVAAGNLDAHVRVTAVGALGSVTSVQILYGGTGYPAAGGGGLTLIDAPYLQTFTLTGVLASNASFVMPGGTYLTASKIWDFNNNTTGAFTVTVQISGTGANVNTPIGTGVGILPGTNNSASTLIQTDGVNDVWLVAPATALLTTTQVQASIPARVGIPIFNTTLNIPCISTGTTIQGYSRYTGVTSCQ